MKKLPFSFYRRDDVVLIAEELMGKMLYTRVEGQLCCGMITETEAYRGRNDKACHANNGRRTKRTEVMYAAGGCAYVYLIYGIHKLLNVVTNVEDQADAVLIRAIEPVFGLETMLERRNLKKKNKRLSSGPGTLSQAMGIDMQHNKMSLRSSELWISDEPPKGHNNFTPLERKNIVKGPRIGIAYAGEDALLPWRFYLKN